MTRKPRFVDKFAQANAGTPCPLGSGKEIRDQLGERPGVNRPVEWLYDVGVDYRANGAQIEFVKHGFYGVF